MYDISKSLTEMTLVERCSLVETVADTLQASADETGDKGDTAFVRNSTCLANTICGMSADLGARDLAAAEILLEQGIMLMHQYANQGETRARH
jgi:hypothetical protein